MAFTAKPLQIFRQNLIEMFLSILSETYFNAHCLVLLFAMETKMQK